MADSANDLPSSEADASGLAPVRPSILDRLLNPDANLLESVRRGILRDLEALLNTERRATGWPKSLRELDTSVLNFGIPCFATTNLTTEQHRAAAVEQISNVIRRFDPRLRDVAVRNLSNSSDTDRTLRFRIEAEVMVDATPIPLVIDTLVDPVSNAISVQGPRQ